MIHRARYQSTICQAAAALETVWLVSSRQVIGSLPCGGSGSVSSIKLKVTCAGTPKPWPRAAEQSLRPRTAGPTGPRAQADPDARAASSDGCRPTAIAGQSWSRCRRRPGFYRGEPGPAHRCPVPGPVPTKQKDRPRGRRYCHPRGSFKHVLAGAGGFDPAAQFLLVERPLRVRHANPAATRPHLAGNQAQASLALGVDRHHGMRRRTTAHAFANLPRPRVRVRVVRKLISLVSWIASTWRPTTAAPVASLHPATSRSTVTSGLARKRLNWTSACLFPSATRRRHVLPARTIPSRNAAPFFEAAIPKPTQRHLHRTSPNAQRVP